MSIVARKGEVHNARHNVGELVQLQSAFVRNNGDVGTDLHPRRCNVLMQRPWIKAKPVETAVETFYPSAFAGLVAKSISMYSGDFRLRGGEVSGLLFSQPAEFLPTLVSHWHDYNVQTNDHLSF